MQELIVYALSLVVTTAVCFVIVLLDERRLGRRHPELLDRAWPPTTRAAAIVAFGPLSLPVHYWRTRRSLAGVLLGLGAALLVVASDEVLAWLVALFVPG